MKIRGLLLAVLLLPMYLPQAAVVRAQQKPEDLAQKSAEAWLALTDSGKYGESWEQASSAFKTALTKEKWVGMLDSVRTPLGALGSRRLNTAKYTKNPPKAPEGEYVILTFDTSFEKLPSAIETVSLILDKDAQWRVAGYLIKPASE